MMWSSISTTKFSIKPFFMFDFPDLLIIGFAVLFGTFGARLFQKLRIPQVVGYIVIGLIIGRSGLNIIDEEHIEAFMPFNFLALGLIGFMIGGELHRSEFKKHGSKFFKILFGESLAAFFAVSVIVSLLTYIITSDAGGSVALGLVLGAIASATAPAATVDVLWEYKTRGILTTTVLAIVALDDALSLVLFSVMSSVSSFLTGNGDVHWFDRVLHSFYELGGAVIVGIAGGLLLREIIRRVKGRQKMLSFIVGVLLVVLGIAMWIEVDVILAAMALGMFIVNTAAKDSKEAFDTLDQFSPPIYALFFVLVGARLTIAGLSFWMWVLVIAYAGGRTAGKILGAYGGGRWAGIQKSVQKYLGLCLFSQAGVAIGLSILASIRFEGVMIGDIAMGHTIAMVVTATTFLVQIIGPPCVKVAVSKAGEVGLNVTEDDLIQAYNVSDVMDPNVPVFSADAKVSDIMTRISDSDAMAFPVVDTEERVVGIVTMEYLKTCLGDSMVGEWLLANDIMEDVPALLNRDEILSDAVQTIRELEVESLPVVNNKEENVYQGMLEERRVNRFISRELFRRRKLADE